MIDGRSLIPTEESDVFIFCGEEIFLVKTNGEMKLCRDGDALRLEEVADGWIEIVEVISRPLN